MAQDFAKKKTNTRKKTAARKKAPAQSAGGGFVSGLKWYGAGILTGVFLSLLLYLGTLPPAGGPQAPTPEQAAAVEEQGPPKPRFDFYTMLPEQSIGDDLPAPEPARTTSDTSKPAEYYLLQAGSFRQREDADRRRAELLLLGLEPSIRESNGDNGRWFRVYLGPFDTRARMSKARSLTAGQNIDTLVLKRSG